MTKWMERKLSELGRITTGKTPPPSQHSFYGGNIPFVTPSDMDIRRTIDTTARYLTNAGAANVKSSFIDKPAICVSCIGSVGKAVLVDQPFVSNQQINSIVVYEYVERLFVYYNLLGRKDEIRFKASGAVQPIMNKSDFGRLTLRIPDQPTQKRIAKVLGSLDDKIELNRRMNETLEEMARTLFRDWFIDFGPTRRQMDGATDPAAIMGHAFPNNKAAALAPLFPARLGEDGLPKSWEVKPFSIFCDIIGGGTPKTSQPAYWDGNIPWFSVVDTPPKGSVFVIETEKNITSKGLKESSARLISAGTTIISARGTVGNLAIAGADMAFNQSCYGLKHTDITGDYFVFLAAQRMVSQLKAMAHGSVFSTITRKTFESISLAMPAPELLAQFEQQVEPLFQRIYLNVTETNTLAQMRDLLLPKLMSGEIQLKDAPMAQDPLD